MSHRKERPSVQKDSKSKRAKTSVNKKRMSLAGLLKLKGQIENSAKTNKLLQIVKSGARSIPYLISKEQHKHLLPQIEKFPFHAHAEEALHINDLRFRELETNLTNSMIFFVQNKEEEHDDLQIIDLQTQKCYQIIPALYFQHAGPEQQDSLGLTRNSSQVQETMFQLTDYMDLVQFNINQQVGAKIRIFMNFVMCMNSIQDLVQINLDKIGQTRRKTKLLRDIVVSRCLRINLIRLKKDRIKMVQTMLLKLRKLKSLENKLNLQIVAGSFVSHGHQTRFGTLYEEYCQVHNNELMKICCKGGKDLCRYWDVTYYVEKGFQEYFTSNLQGYLLEIIRWDYDVDKLRKTFSVNKKNFRTTPSNLNSSNSYQIDESYEVDALENIELIVKEGTEREIVKIFGQGVRKYNFCTENIESSIYSQFKLYLGGFYSEVLTGSPESAGNLKILSPPAEVDLSEPKNRKRVAKLSWSKYEKCLEILITRMEYITQRTFSVVSKIISQALKIEVQHPEKYQIICSYMVELLIAVLTEADDAIATFVRVRTQSQFANDGPSQFFKSKDEIKSFDLETENMKTIIKHIKKYEGHLEGLRRLFPLTNTEFEGLMSEGQDPSAESTETEAKEHYCPKLKSLKCIIIRAAYNNLHKSITERQLRSKLEEETWEPVAIDQSIYELLGYIIGGNEFVFEEERRRHMMLSSSLLLDKAERGKQEPPAHSYNKEDYSSRFKVNKSFIVLDHIKFKLTSSTVSIISFLKHYLELFDDTLSEDKKLELHHKVTECILIYNQYVKNLILKQQAVKFGRIKGSSITAKHLVLVYIQLQLVDLIFCGRVLRERISISSEESEVLCQKVTATREEIRKKYRKILELRLLDNVESLDLKEENLLNNQSFQKIPRNFNASLELFSDLELDESEFQGFIDVDTKWIVELLNKVGRGVHGQERKVKYFTCLDQIFEPVYKHMPNLRVAIRSVIS